MTVRPEASFGTANLFHGESVQIDVHLERPLLEQPRERLLPPLVDFGWAHELDLPVEVIHADPGPVAPDGEHGLVVLPGHAAHHDDLVERLIHFAEHRCRHHGGQQNSIKTAARSAPVRLGKPRPPGSRNDRARLGNDRGADRPGISSS